MLIVTGLLFFGAIGFVTWQGTKWEGWKAGVSYGAVMAVVLTWAILLGYSEPGF